MTSPEQLQQSLQGWADTQFPSRAQASEALAKAVGVSASSARGYIDYRMDKAAYEIAYKVWKYLRQQGANGV